MRGRACNGIYICDDETGEPVDQTTIFDGSKFTVYQSQGRIMLNRAIWPEENQLEKVIQGTGREVREWIEDQVGCEVDISVMKEGLIPVYRDLKEDEQCEDLELRILPYDDLPMPKPEYKDWTGDLTRDPDYKARISHRFWLAENKRRDEIRLAWFREMTAEGCKQYWTEFEAYTRERTEEWMQQELIKWSVEDSELEKLREEVIEGIACSFRAWLIDD
jgi:hypothetical protein